MKDVVLFGPNRAQPDGLQTHCKACRAVWRDRHRVDIRAKDRIYSAGHRVAKKAYDVAYREPRRATLASKQAARYNANREEYCRRQRERYPLKRTARLERSRRAYQANREERIAATVEWARQHPEQKAAVAARRRARKAGAAGRHTAREWQLKVAEYLGRCAYCGRPGRLVRDHVIPLARGGSDGIENIAPACVSCNCSKGATLLAEFLDRPGVRR